MVKLKYRNLEEIHQMLCHKWYESEKCGHDVGEGAFLDWTEKYARDFAKWADTIPEECVNCGLHKDNSHFECIQPFDKHRIQFIIDQGLA